MRSILLSNSLENPTEALGWVMQLRNRAGILEARIDWTGLGRPLVEGTVYKFFSTEYDRDACQTLGERTVGGKTYKLVRPLVLSGLALTNDPNNKGQRPISNRYSTFAGLAGETDQVKAQRISNRANELQAAHPRWKFDACWQQATREIASA